MCIEYNRAPVESYAYLPLRLRPLNACFVHGTTVRLRPLDGIRVGVGIGVTGVGVGVGVPRRSIDPITSNNTCTSVSLGGHHLLFLLTLI